MSSFKIIKDSCLNQNVDAIVNAANGYMNHGGGVAKAILDKAGKELDEACQKYKLPVRDGSVIVTPAFNIKNAKIIIHAVGPNLGITNDAFGELCDAYYNSLVELKNLSYHSIAFPLISSGIFGGNLDNAVALSTKYCIKAYNRFLNDFDYDIDVLLCAYSDDEYTSALAEQERLNKEQIQEEIYGFNSIDEIIEYLKHDYKKVEFYTPDPSYTISSTGEKIYYMGGLKYDMRVFEIPKYLINNDYIDEKYFDIKKYPDLFEEKWEEYDFNTIDISRVSFFILRVFNSERIIEGCIDNMIENGYILKAIERAKTIKES